VLIPLYPLTLHFGISAGSTTLGIIILCLLFLLVGIDLIIKSDLSGWLLLLLGLLLLACQVSYPAAAMMMLFLPPIAINLLLGFVFARTLRKGSMPLISIFAQIAHGHELDAIALRYTRTLTQVWLGVFISFALLSLLLAIFAPLEIWSLFTNFIFYILMVLLFLIEYQVRIRRLSHLKHHGFVGSMRLIKKLNLRSLSKP
jgi:uncharacterized membrane protein